MKRLTISATMRLTFGVLLGLTGIDLVNKAVGQMDQVTQSAATQTEDLSSTSQSLASQAQNLRALVGKFKLGDEERSPRTVPFAVPPVPIAPVIAPAPRKRPEPVKAATNGHATNGHANGHATNGHATNGHGIDGFEEF